MHPSAARPDLKLNTTYINSLGGSSTQTTRSPSFRSLIAGWGRDVLTDVENHDELLNNTIVCSQRMVM